MKLSEGAIFLHKSINIYPTPSSAHRMAPDDLSNNAAKLLANLEKNWVDHDPPAMPKNVNESIGGVSMTNEAALELEQKGLIRIEKDPISARWKYYPTKKFPGGNMDND